jgi:heme exporter protein D
MIQFRFASLSEFAFMDGHGIYVWGCTAIALVILASLLLYPLLSARAQLRRIQRQQVLRQAQQNRHRRAATRAS